MTMTDQKRRLIIEKLIADYTAENAVDRAKARRTLIDEGIYTSRGTLRVEFGGASKKAKAAA